MQVGHRMYTVVSFLGVVDRILQIAAACIEAMAYRDNVGIYSAHQILKPNQILNQIKNKNGLHIVDYY